MSDTEIWVSAVLMDSRIVKSFSNDLEEASRDRLIEAQKANDTGQSLPREMLATEFYYDYPDKLPKTLPPLF